MRKKNFASGMAVCLAFALTIGSLSGIGDGVLGKAVKAAEGTDADVASGGAGTVTGDAVSTESPEPTETPTATPAATPDLSVYKLSAPTVTLRGGSKRVRVNWSKVAGADGYYVYYRDSSTAAFTKAKNVTSGSTVEYVKTSLPQKTTYYFRVAAYKKVNTTVVEGNLSSVVSAKTASVSATSKAAKKYKTKTSFTKSPAYKTYKKMKNAMNYSKSFAIPGMTNTNVAGFACTTMIPQAVCYAGSYLLISAYDSKGVDYSVIYVISKASKSYVTTIVLPSKAKVGGMAYDGTNIWVSKGSSVACFPYSFVTEAVNGGSAYKSLGSYTSVCKVLTTASYIGYYNGTLWIGANKTTASSTMYGYSIANKTTAPSLSRTYKMAVPSKTQGIAFTTDGTLILSRSYRTQKSKSGYVSQIRTYYPSYANVGSNGKVLKNSALKKITMPPKVEGMAVYGSYTYTLFSSSCYRSCKYPVDRVIALKTRKLIG
ncbi:MAG: fibronectin type III domain-containing protein [Lachnospiraceae bacterium]|nr:fibronectin type III domain-containing protein [Lachnospiraceae bacterium]